MGEIVEIWAVSVLVVGIMGYGGWFGWGIYQDCVSLSFVCLFAGNCNRDAKRLWGGDVSVTFRNFA